MSALIPYKNTAAWCISGVEEAMPTTDAELLQRARAGDKSAFGELVRRYQGLGLHYRVSRLAAGDCSASMAKTYDLEVWIPSMREYKEVSSASNAHCYQARRGNIRFKREVTGANEFGHTLNASGLATSRLLPAMAEQFQRENGSMAVPEVLRRWVGKNELK